MDKPLVATDFSARGVAVSVLITFKIVLPPPLFVSFSCYGTPTLSYS